MRFLTTGNRHFAQCASGATGTFKRAGSTLMRTCFLVVAATIALSGEVNSQTAEPRTPNLNKPLLLPEVNRPPDANDVMKMREQQNKNKSFEAANIERKRQISDDSATLLKLATELKNAVDKTSKDTLSIGIIRKADEIERLAHGVKEKMKLTVGAN